MRLSRILIPAAVALALLLPATEARSVRPYSMEVLVDGRPLEEFHARGNTYVMAEEGHEYTIRLRNHTGERVAVALAVDGLNSIDAKRTSARGAAKWILAPYRTMTVRGWQTGEHTARRFFFTTEDDSYGQWLGETDNLGLISAAFFRERPRPVRPYTRRAPSKSRDGDRRAAAPQAESMLDDSAATGIGRELDNSVRRVHFREESTPAAVIDVRYEYRDALVRLGVIPPRHARHRDSLKRREHASGFTDTGFAPDPYRHGRR